MKPHIQLAILALAGISGFAQSSMTVVNGASFDGAQPITMGSYASALGDSLCSTTAASGTLAPDQLPATLGTCSVMVNGVQAGLVSVSPSRVDFIMPTGLMSGQATVQVMDGGQTMMGTATIGSSGPGMFAVNGMGVGEGSMFNGTMMQAGMFGGGSGTTPQMGPFSIMTNGQSTYVSMYVTGLDPTVTPTVTIGGVPVDVSWFGTTGYAGIQQIFFTMPAAMAGVGRVPVMITQNGMTSNVTYMHILPTNDMMSGMPGWGSGMMIGDNMARSHEMSGIAYNATNGTALVTDENDDVLRVISLSSSSTTATVTLPAGSQAHSVAVNAAGTLAAVTLSAKGSVAIIDLIANKVKSVIATGSYPSRAAFAGSTLLVTNSAAGTVSVIDTANAVVTQTLTAGLGTSGIAVNGTTALVANMQAGTVSFINLSTFAVSSLALPAGARPREIAVSAQSNKAIITTPMSNGFFVLDLSTNAIAQVDTSSWNGMGPGAVALNGNSVYLTNQMTASVTVADLTSGTILKTFAVDPGPMALAAATSKNELLVLAEGTGTLDVVDMSTYGLVTRINAGDTERTGQFSMPVISSIAPNSGSIGSTLTITLTGSGFQNVQNIEFVYGVGMGGGGMMGGPGVTSGQADATIKVSNIQANSTGTQITATVQITSSALPGTRRVRLQTSYGSVMGSMNSSTAFTVTK